MINVAIMGYGVVGSGVAELLDSNSNLFEEKLGQPVQVKYILDIRDFVNDKYQEKLIKDFNTIVTDNDIQVVVETIGGTKVPYEYTLACLKAGKHVITSNKELVSIYGAELCKIAKENHVNYLFEAAVGGGIPILHPILNCLNANKITKIVGILNGTTNYILTKMIHENTDFETALKEAQKLGYAEADPSADIEGKDTSRKICILSALAFGKYISPDKIETIGIQNLTLEDIKQADRQGKVIKLLGVASKENDDTIHIFVSPCAIDKKHFLANIKDVYNGIIVTGDAVGDTVFIGKGAGKFPTASAVCSNIIEAIQTKESTSSNWNETNKIKTLHDLNLDCIEKTHIPILD